MYKILVVDDNVFDREGVIDLIDWDSLDIQIAGTALNGEEGYKKALELEPDFVLTDVAMPLLNGIQMTKKIKQKFPDTLFVYMSCFDEFDFVKNAISLDVSAYVLKPVDLRELTEALEKIKKIKKNEETIKENLDELKSKVKESLPVLREQLMRDLVFSKTLDMKNLEEKMIYLGINYQETYLISLFQIDNYELLYENIPAEDRYLMIYNLKKIIEDIIAVKYKSHLLIQDTSNLCVVVSGSWEKNEDALEEIIEDCLRCKEEINKRLAIKVTIGISEFSNNIYEVPKLFISSERAVKSKFYGEGNRIILSSEVEQKENIYNYNFVDLKKDITAILEKGTEEDILFLLDKYCAINIRGSEIYVKSLYFSIVNAVQIFLNERNESFSNVFENETIIWEKLSKFETILDIRQWMVNIINSVKQYLASREYKWYQNFVEKVKGIIQEDYASIQNMEQITERLFISSSYGNSIFKQETGKSIFEYLIIVRIEKAKEMLLDSYYKIYEISEAVGYKSKSYFGSIFKEYTGLTPKQYKDKYSM